ncbi:MAG: C39 family peptidase [Phycisphaerales bacterium]
MVLRVTALCWVWAASSAASLAEQPRHTLVMHDSFTSVRGGAATIRLNAGMLPGPAWLELRPIASPPDAPGPDPDEDLAFYESAEVTRTGPPGDNVFTEALLSWNIDVPSGCGIRLDVLVRDAATNVWSPPLFIGSWGDAATGTGPAARPQTTDTGIKVDIDYLRSERPLNALMYHITAARTGSAAGGAGAAQPPVLVRRMAVCLSDTRTKNTAPVGQLVPTRIGRLGVPFRTQKTTDEALTGRLCSPTSLSMVLAHRGVDLPVERVAALTLDPHFGIYGNWPRNVQAAFSVGVPGYLTRLNTWAELEGLVSSGNPVIISIAVEPGELRGAPYADTRGHLIVVEGFDSEGNVLVNDPAAPTAEQGQLTYPRADLTTVWLRRVDGTAYVLLPRETAP